MSWAAARRSAATGQHLERILELDAAGAIRPPQVTLYTLSEAVAAHKVSDLATFAASWFFWCVEPPRSRFEARCKIIVALLRLA